MVLVGLSMAWSTTHPFGTTPPGDSQRHSWVIQNRGTNPLKLRTHFTSGHCGFSLWLGEDHVISAGGLFTVSLTCPTPDRGSIPYSAYADVFTDDPQSPKVRFRVFGITSPSVAP
jgi:hypothetical protein